LRTVTATRDADPRTAGGLSSAIDSTATLSLSRPPTVITTKRSGTCFRDRHDATYASSTAFQLSACWSVIT
jgi:hypothetical protein